MPVKGGRFTLSGSADFSITGLGFSPDLILFFWNNTTAENVLEAVGGIAGFGYTCRNNDLPGTVNSHPPTASTHELWQGNRASSAYLATFAHWVRSGHGGGGFAVSCRSLDLDGFTMGYDPDFTGGAGYIVYYLAFGEEPDLLTRRDYFTRVDSSMPTPFPPLTGFSVGSGGSNPFGSGGGGGSFIPAPAADVGTWALTNVYDVEENGREVAIYMQRGLINGSSVATMLNNIDSDLSHFENHQLYADTVQVGGGLDFFGQFNHSADDTHYFASHSHPDIGFVATDGRISVAAVGGLMGYGGQVTPSSVIGGEVEVAVPLDVEAVIFFCPSHRFYTDFTSFVVGGTGFGFMEPDFQAVVMVGGEWDDASARWQSPLHSWVSNITQPTGGAPSYGTCEITPTGFKLITAANDQPMEAIMYMAYGFIQEGAGFFRVVHR
jgi:hypothetical protein